MDDTHKQLLSAVATYQTPQAAVEMLRQNPPLIIAATTASGKNTVADYILERTKYRELVSHTTRQPREGEVNGVHYWFVSPQEMLDLIKGDAFIEVQAIHGDTVYGTSIKAYQTAQADGHQPLLVMDVQGVEELMHHVPGLKPVFILPPNYEEWMDRLHKRGAISEVEKEKRLDSARREIELALQERFTLVINRDVGQAAEEILSGLAHPAKQEQNRQVAQQLLDSINNR